MADDPLLNERERNVIRWRCRRGLVENDLFVEQFFARHGDSLTRSQADALAALMDLSDNDLLDLLLRRKEPQDTLATPQVLQLLELMRRPPAGAAHTG